MRDAAWVVGTNSDLVLAGAFMREVAASGISLAVAVVGPDPYEGPFPWVALPNLSVGRIVDRLKPRRFIFLTDTPQTRALAALKVCPAIWINGSSADLLTLGQVTVSSAARAQDLGGGILTGDPLIDLPAIESVGRTFCDRFQSVRAANRWLLYFAGTTAGEEDIAYKTFLHMSAVSGGLLALAPADSARHEGIYRESIRYHLLTTRQRRLITSEVPPKTRVYYIEDDVARRAMYACADVVVVGGTFAGGTVDILSGLAEGAFLVVGPQRTDPLVQALLRAGMATACTSSDTCAQVALSLIAAPSQRAENKARTEAWLDLQKSARPSVLGLLR